MLPMTSSPAARHRTATLVSTLASRFARLRGCGSGAIALASFLLLPLAAAAVPMAPLTPAASAPAGASSGMNGPKRPGLIPPASPSLSRAGGSADGLPQAPRRPVPG